MIKTRLQIIDLLRQKQWTARELALHFETSKQAVQYHLTHLTDKKIAKRRLVQETTPDGLVFTAYRYWIAS